MVVDGAEVTGIHHIHRGSAGDKRIPVEPSCPQYP